MDLKTKKKYYNLCDPYEPLMPDDKRNVDLDLLDEEGGRPVRGIKWVDMLLNEIMLSDKPVYKLFTGHRGSGKTTEFEKLKAQLYNKFNLFPVLINSEEIIDLENPIDVPDIIASIIYSTEKAIIQEEGDNTEKALDEGYLKRFWNFLKNTEVELNKAKFEFAIPSAGKLVSEIKTRPTLRQRVRTIVASNFSEFIREAKDELISLNANVVHKFGRDGIVIIFDSLEKLEGTSDNWHKVLESAELVFKVNAAYMRLPVHVLYTVPPALSTRITDIDFMPMIKVCDRNRNRHEPGLAAARELIRRRVPEDILQELFGLNLWDRIDDLILWSGGYPRDMLHMLQKIIAVNDHPLSDSDFEHIIAYIRNQYRRIITGDALHWLANVATTKDLTIEGDVHLRAADRMLNQHVVLSYLNNDSWYDLHPTVYQIPNIKKAIQNLEEELERGEKNHEGSGST
ncbi:MAG: hypothetical protein ABIN18_01100 [Pseudomonadota bacterium]